jgi:hypothetical protein
LLAAISAASCLFAPIQKLDVLESAVFASILDRLAKVESDEYARQPTFVGCLKEAAVRASK